MGAVSNVAIDYLLFLDISRTKSSEKQSCNSKELFLLTRNGGNAFLTINHTRLSFFLIIMNHERIYKSRLNLRVSKLQTILCRSLTQNSTLLQTEYSKITYSSSCVRGILQWWRVCRSLWTRCYGHRDLKREVVRTIFYVSLYDCTAW